MFHYFGLSNILNIAPWLFSEDMFKLWSLAEQDLLSPTTTYRLRDTGQGLQRVQPCPRTSRIMHSILNKAQQNIGSWVGSSVIHLGDTAVPNALMFIGTSTFGSVRVDYY